MTALRLVAVAMVFIQTSLVSAQPEPKEVLPPPTVVPTERVITFYRTNRRDVWQYYAVDRSGRFRPRVILSPYGAYYPADGKPFPWVQTHELEIMPYVVD